MHMIGQLQEQVPENETEKQLIELMTTVKIGVGLGTMTMRGIQEGLGYSFSLLFLWTGVIGLLLAKPLSQNPSTLKRISIVYSCALVLETAVSVIYFFIIPTACIALALLFFVIAAFKIK